MKMETIEKSEVNLKIKTIIREDSKQTERNNTTEQKLKFAKQKPS